jgi:hypothetical protein
MSSGSDIQDRLTRFSVQVMELCERMPKSFAARHLGEQLFRSGTASAARLSLCRPTEFVKSASRE